MKRISRLNLICTAIIAIAVIFMPQNTVYGLTTTEIVSNDELYKQMLSEITYQQNLYKAADEKKKVKPAIEQGFVNIDIPLFDGDIVEAYIDDIIDIPAGKLSTTFGYDSWRHGQHTGIDIVRPRGSEITAAAKGVVKKVYNGCTHNYSKQKSCGCGGGYGNYVIIDHGGGVETLYGHCQAIYVKEGQTVNKNQPIAEVGSTGFSTGWHLHFEIHQNGKAVDPLKYNK